MSDLTNMSWAELLDGLRKDLLLDATTDLLPGTVLASLIDNNGKAAFLQLLTAQKLRLAWGSGTFSFTAGQANSPFVTVTHGLGVVPVVVVGTVAENAADPVQTTMTFRVQPASFTTTQFAAIGNLGVTTPSTFTTTFWWIAIG